MTQLQATAVLNTRLFVKKRFGQEAWRRVLEALDPRTRALFEAIVFAVVPGDAELDLKALTMLRVRRHPREP